ENDPLLNYPLGRSGGRAPLLNMMAIGFGTLLSPVMDEVDAIGIGMQFIPALFGALLVFPVYFIGKTLFGKKEGLLAALLVALIPIHLGSGHGSAFSLFDHDSLNLLLFFITYFFLIKAIKETDTTKSILYALLGGIPLAGLSMVWVEHEFLYTVIAVYAVVQMIIDIFTSKIDIRVPRSVFITLLTGYLVSLPVLLSKGGFSPDITLFLCLGMGVFGLFYLFLKRNNIPWTLSLPTLFILGAAAVAFLFFVPTLAESFPALSPLNKFSDILFGAGIYGNKVSLTIAEAGTYGISRTVMSFGPALFWMAWVGFVFIGYHYLKHVNRRDMLFFLVLFLIQIWFIGIAGRFMNDLVPFVALFSAWLILALVRKFDYQTMIKNIKSAGSGIRGLRKGVNFLHIFGILFVAFLVFFPNAYLSLDAAVPATEKEKVFDTLPSGAFGTSFGKEAYWVDAYSWFAKQDNEIQNPVDRPAFISWWDYGFYEVAIGGHPTVADNFQDGIPPSSNFHISTSEKEAVSIWIIRLLEGNVEENGGTLDSAVVLALETHLDANDSTDLINWVENPEQSPSYGQPIASQYNPNISKNYPVGEQWPMNAVYHDGINVLSTLSDENLTMLYREVQDTTGKSIRYYGVEGYDKQIFNIFAFLADKSLLLIAGREDANPEDDFEQIKYVTQTGQELSYDQVKARTDQQNRNDPIVDTKTIYKNAYYDTMFYRTYIGLTNNQSGQLSEPQYQLPCLNMKHFYAQYISPYPKYAYTQGQSAVVIAKYYEGAFINGSILFQDETKDFEVVVQQNISHYGTTIPIDHDKNTSFNGSYEVLVPAGVINLQVRRYPELGENAFTVQNVTFNAMDSSSLLTPITEDEATRQSEYHRHINITITPGSLSGYVYENNDNESAYNASVDQPLANVTLSVYGIDALDPNTGQPTAYDFTMIKTLTTDENGYYNTSDLLPGYYQFVATDKDGFQLENTLIPVYGENNTHDVAKPKPGAAEGTIYFDSNDNGQYDAGEEMKDATVELRYTMTGENKLVDSTVTDETGSYLFTNLVPGGYQLNTSKLPNYETTVNVTINEDQTNMTNVSMQYAKVTVTGTTKNQNTMNTVANMTLSFAPDTTVVNNTAMQGSVKSDSNGDYTIELMPGSYTVTVGETVNESGINATYSYTGPLTLSIGQGSKTYDVLLARESE
ncbi:MAG: carboxypeptidase regulatory-like domain-containing protein, partial [Thermoplasmatota archaeon]